LLYLPFCEVERLYWCRPPQDHLHGATRLGVAADADEATPQLDGGREFTVRLKGSMDRGDVALGDAEHQVAD
jgi:hypothetical protein